MAKSVGTLFVNLVTKTTKFDKGMKGARSKLKTFSQSVANVGKKILTFGSILTGVAIGGMAVFVRGQLESIDKLAKMAKSLDITTEGLIGLQHAAELTAGVTGDKLAVAFKRMQKTISDASVAGGGLSTAIRALKQLKLSAEDLKNLAPEKQFAAIAEGFKSIGNQADKARIAQDVFGRSGGALLPMLKLGSQGLKDMAADAESLGLMFSGEEAAKVEEFNDQMARLSKMVGGLGRGFVINVAPGAAEAIEGLVLLVQQWNKLQGKAKETKEWLGKQFNWTGQALGGAYRFSERKIWDPLFQGLDFNKGPTARGANRRFMQGGATGASQSTWTPAGGGGASQSSWVRVLEDIRDNTAQQEEPAIRMALP